MSPSSVAEASGGVPGAISVWGCLCRVWQWSRRSDADIGTGPKLSWVEVSVTSRLCFNQAVLG